jgi:hypothetical protein
MRGYVGYRKSVRAALAEQEEKYPLSIASSFLAEKLKWSNAKAKAFLKLYGPCEWHHTSKMFNETDYYNISDEWIEDNKEELNSFIYIPEKAKKAVLQFKCWNISQDIRYWDWKITNRFGNNCYDLNTVVKKLKEIETSLLQNKSTHKTQIRIKNEQMKVLIEIKNKVLISKKSNEENNKVQRKGAS